MVGDQIYRDFSLRTLPHRFRLRHTIRLLRRLCPMPSSYADVGSLDGFVADKIARALNAKHTVCFDYAEECFAEGPKVRPRLQFRLLNLCHPDRQKKKFELVTCLGTLEHVLDLEPAIDNLLAMTGGVLLMDVPIEIGFRGRLKFRIKKVFGQPLLSEEQGQATVQEYWQALQSGEDISRFRQRADKREWACHAGFDYRQIEKLLKARGVPFQSYSAGFYRYVIVRTPSLRRKDLEDGC